MVKKMKKSELASALAVALNLLNDLQGMNPTEDELAEGWKVFDVKNRIHSVIGSIPSEILEKVDFRNNGTVTADDLT
jgi:hypothetical protein